jgi:hypothetical protein
MPIIIDCFKNSAKDHSYSVLCIDIISTATLLVTPILGMIIKK